MKGVADASLATAIECVLVGDEPRIQAVLDTVSYDPAHIRIHHASDAVGMQEVPREALEPSATPRSVVGASTRRAGAGRRARERRQHGRVSARLCPRVPQHQGRAEAGARERVPAAHRPSRCRINWRSCSTSGRRCAATPSTSCSSRSWAASYAQRISKVARPRVALLNMGAEPFKGGDVLAEAHERLLTVPAVHFIGNIEGNDIAKGTRRRDRLRGLARRASS